MYLQSTRHSSLTTCFPEAACPPFISNDVVVRIECNGHAAVDYFISLFIKVGFAWVILKHSPLKGTRSIPRIWCNLYCATHPTPLEHFSLDKYSIAMLRDHDLIDAEHSALSEQELYH